MILDWELVVAHRTEIGQSFALTLELSAVTLLASTPAALAVAVARVSGPRPAAAAAAAFVTFFRAVPILVVLYFAFYALPSVGIALGPLEAALLGLGIAATAYLAEDLRGPIAAVDHGQWQAARALGLPFWHTLRRIVLPQALPGMLPPYVSRAILVVKSTSVASIVAVNELTGETYALASGTYHAVEFLAVAAGLYLVVNAALSVLQEGCERWVRRRFG